MKKLEPVETITVKYNGNYYLSIYPAQKKLPVIELVMHRDELITLKKEIDEVLYEALIKAEERMSRKEAAQFLKIPYTTVCRWSKEGKLKEYGTGRKRYFLKPELMSAIKIKEKING